MLNRGTFEGDLAEIEFVKNFNKGRYIELTNQHFRNLQYIYCVHVNTHQHSNTSDLQVKPKSDAYLIQTQLECRDFLIENDFYLNESNIVKLDYEIISNSGISIKMSDSKSYQIHKFTVSSFLEVFKDSYLGAGAMIYSQKQNELSKNLKILSIWNISLESFFSHFSKFLIITPEMELETCRKIKEYSVKKIRSIILENKNLWHVVFTGQGIFDSPYCTHFSYIDNKFTEFEGSDFYITTGSGRIKSPTIVVKPK